MKDREVRGSSGGAGWGLIDARCGHGTIHEEMDSILDSQHRSGYEACKNMLNQCLHRGVSNLMDLR